MTVRVNFPSATGVDGVFTDSPKVAALGGGV